VIGDPTEIERPHAWKTEYVGKLKDAKERIPGSPSLKKGKKWKRYSGLFVLLKQKWTLSQEQKTTVLEAALTTFRGMIYPYIRTFV
jgi:hypothetical protein